MTVSADVEATVSALRREVCALHAELTRDTVGLSVGVVRSLMGRA